MRRTTVLLLALAPLVASGRAAAQDSVRRAVTLPLGATMTRQCAQWLSEGILILTADSRDPGPAAPAYLARLAAAMERRLMHVSTDSSVLVSSFAARLIRSGSVSGLLLLRPSGRDGFDMDARVAADFAKGDPILVAMPPSVPDSLVVLISIGRRQDGSDFIVRHQWCPAAPLPNNPPPEYPATAMLWRSRSTIRVRFMVDSTGTVDSASVNILDPTNQAFTEALRRYFAKQRYLAAEFDGVKEKQQFRKSVTFVPPEEQTAESR